MSSTTVQDAKGVVEWINSNNGYFNTSSVEIKKSNLGGIGVFAKTDIKIDPTKPPPVILRIHKDSIFSYQKSSIANILYESKMHGALALILSFIYEKSLGKDSPWYSFIKSIRYLNDDNSPILPPSSWTSKEKALLKGSELERMDALSDEINLENFEKACTFALIHLNSSNKAIAVPFELDIENKTAEETREKYRHFMAISYAIATRYFEIDRYHEVSLVPGADLFNHADRPHVRFESLYEVCNMCGSSVGCDHIEEKTRRKEGIEAEEEEEEEQGEEVKEEVETDDEELSDEEPEFYGPIEDFIELIEEAFQREKEEEEASQLLENEDDQNFEDSEFNPIIIDESDNPISIDDCCDITVTRDIKKGQEIFNTYGDLNNSVLFNKYGFILEDNIYDGINLGQEFLQLRKLRKSLFNVHFKWWENKGYEMVKELLNRKKNDRDNGMYDGTKENRNTNENGDDTVNLADENNENIGEKEDKENTGGCQSGCCDVGKDNENENDDEDDTDDDDEEDDDWNSKVGVSFDGEPNMTTIALVRLLSFKKPELIKFMKNDYKKIQLLFIQSRTSKKRYNKILRDILGLRLQKYDLGIDYNDLKRKNPNNTRIQNICELMINEQSIVYRSLDLASKST
ncbi:hypothetical protein WICMUC_003928 [Wickerhamomyces mucosus]|uniref:SET domain-containing protein n=1 Tax=Wickerhamomyces mucosus TaxID=1378264 RepID=A0A9P8PK74_9ASCO|nr:hypothetical protein WICMUC_003928 [Wickerhamomyces mucosus]